MYRVFLVSFFVVGICGVAVFGQEKVKRDPGELKAIESLRASGALVLEVAQNDPRLEVSFLQPVEKFGAGTLAPLKDIKALAALNLRAQPLNDEVSAQLAPLTGLVHLKGMKDLEYLNLYDTQITDKGLASLVELKKLKNLYLWQTKVTKEAANKLKEQLKGCDVNVGVEFVPLPEPKDMPKAPAKDAKAKAKDAAKDAGKEKAKDAAKDAGKEKAKEAAKDAVKEKAKS